MEQPYDSPRTRGWMLIRDVDWTRVLERWDDLSELGGDDYVIIRASFVESWFGNGSVTLIAIDAKEGKDFFSKAVDAIKKTLETDSNEYVIANHLIPDPPHIASGYITRQEAHKAIDEGERGGRPGRQDHSPGFNPWG